MLGSKVISYGHSSLYAEFSYIACMVSKFLLLGLWPPPTTGFIPPNYSASLFHAYITSRIEKLPSPTIGLHQLEVDRPDRTSEGCSMMVFTSKHGNFPRLPEGSDWHRGWPKSIFEQCLLKFLRHVSFIHLPSLSKHRPMSRCLWETKRNLPIDKNQIIENPVNGCHQPCNIPGTWNILVEWLFGETAISR